MTRRQRRIAEIHRVLAPRLCDGAVLPRCTVLAQAMGCSVMEANRCLRGALKLSGVQAKMRWLPEGRPGLVVVEVEQ